MNDWLKRHLVLTRQEQLLISGILIILLCGLAVRHCSHNAAEELNPDQKQEIIE